MLVGYGWENEPLRFQTTQSPHQVTDLEREAATTQPVNERLPTLSSTLIAD
jgi:dethiobiotin synthetase